MKKQLGLLLLACTAGVLFAANLQAKTGPILGQWISDKKDLIVEVYQNGSGYQGKIVWVSDKNGQPEKRLDDKNPNHTLRNRSVIGLDVLQGLVYNENENCYDKGHIYDATSGKTYSVTARLDENETLIVRGYWGFQLFGKTLIFNRYRPNLNVAR